MTVIISLGLRLDIYNPFSLLNALERKKIDNYWFGSGTPTYLVEMLRKFHVLPSEVGAQHASHGF